ncbi:MAG: Hint domain-containing protein, partial [Jannaschia sp.]
SEVIANIGFAAGLMPMRVSCSCEGPILPAATLYTLEASQISVSGGGSLSGITQGDGSHLVGRTLTLNSNLWKTVQVFDDDANFEDNDTSQVLDGAQTYGGTNHPSGRRVEAEYRLTVQDPSGNTYTVIGFNINEPGGNAFGTVEGLAFIGPIGGFPPIGVPLRVLSAQEGPGGATTPYASYATPPCFTPGTLIATPSGTVRIEDLVIGDVVSTRDGGDLPVRWIGRTTVGWHDLLTQPRLRPIAIERDAFGPDQPRRRMLVSPQHRILRTAPAAAILFGTEEVLISAKHMTDLPGVRRADDVTSVTYIHLAFATHEIVMSDGLWSESLLPADVARSGLSVSARHEIDTLFGLSRGARSPVAARPCLKAYEARVYLAA